MPGKYDAGYILGYYPLKCAPPPILKGIPHHNHAFCCVQVPYLHLLYGIRLVRPDTQSCQILAEQSSIAGEV